MAHVWGARDVRNLLILNSVAFPAMAISIAKKIIIGNYMEMNIEFTYILINGFFPPKMYFV